ncbi:hypothetical protein H5410_055745 [Solanum commersonii]|uniref:Uncharacterized protein n=1 Tax=Solanum commersonii TaxID=4109 RepID=A0A9J5WID8_SOLCO|nr:hypothetical protein H5410_055745 [Solanum commersonii]
MIKPQPLTNIKGGESNVNKKVTIHIVITEWARLLVKGLQETSRKPCDIHNNYFLIQKVMNNKPQEHLRPKNADPSCNCKRLDSAIVNSWCFPEK